MSWDTLAWRPVAADPADAGTDALVEIAPMIRSAVDEAVSAHVLGSVTVERFETASVPAAGLPDGFSPVSSIELLGTPRRLIRVALDPTVGAVLGGASIEATGLAAALLESIDAALSMILGEGLAVGPADTATADPTAELALYRLALRAADGSQAGLAVAVDASLAAEFATHVVALRALSPGAMASNPPRPATPASREPQPSVDPSPNAEDWSGASAADPAFVGPTAASPTSGQTPLAAMSGAAAGAFAATSAGPAASARPSAPPAVAPAAAAAPTHAAAPVPAASVQPFRLEELPPAATLVSSQNIELLMGVSLQVTVEIGRTKLAIREVLALTPGSIVELDKLAGEKVDVLVNGQPIAQGEVVVVDENFGVRITDVVSRQRRILSADHAA